ncbi:unnamed protein product [Lactuca saligna]|uniref:Uncharacterized protein n=1 Tax=Lactuca saligna TaxID=75948 RepID=A0AA35VF10_LACSI|nr:unnamed protein product [Lactuca saligna]
MVASSETPSVAKQTASTIMLNIKPNQNLVLDLESSKYTDSLKSMIEFLQYSLLAQALTMAESLPLIHLLKAFSTADYKIESFSERGTGSDTASKLFFTLIYGLYKGIYLDVGSIH